MRVLVACEYSGTVRRAFEAKGHLVMSCDLLPADDGAQNHHKGDVFDLLGPDLIIMHPPCTALAVSGNRWYGNGMPRHADRLEAIKWTVGLFDAAKEAARMVCMENPVGVLPMPATQYIQP